MSEFIALLRSNRNYRCLWLGQVASEAGDYFNNIAVFSLALQTGGSGLLVSGVMLARAIPAAAAGPAAGVVLDRLDRRRIMIASNLARAAVAAAFLITVERPSAWLLYLLSALLMFASPFFSSGRAAILPSIASAAELHTANALTQTTQWATITAGTLAAGYATAWLGYRGAFVFNALAFLISAGAVALVRPSGDGFRARRERKPHGRPARPWTEYAEGLGYMRSAPLTFGIAMVSVGWATGGGAAQILFALFGEQVFHRGPAGIGTIWAMAGVGLLIGGGLGHRLGRHAGFAGYKRTVSISYLSHGAAYVLFSQMENYAAALGMIMLSRVGMAVASVLNQYQLMRHTPDAYRGRVFSTLESLRWAVMIGSMAAAGIASQYFSPRAIGFAAGVASSLTAVWWTWADWTGRLPEPRAGSQDHEGSYDVGRPQET